MATRLGVYNAALVESLGERRLASLTENREPRRVLDAIWDDGFVDYVLSRGMWKFAARTVRLDYDPDFTASFGFTRRFLLPDDFIRTIMISADERFSMPMLDYSEERDYIFCDYDAIYLQFVSNDASYGNDLTMWTDPFTDYASVCLALKACKRLTQSKTSEDDLKSEEKKKLVQARSLDAFEQPTKFMPRGSWSSARSTSSRRNRGHDTNGTLVT